MTAERSAPIGFSPWSADEPGRPAAAAASDRPRFETPAIEPHTAHVWSFDLRADAERLARLGDLLSADERARAGRYRFDRHRRRFIVGQGTLRLLLGGYTTLEPAEVRFALGEKGKPSLVQRPDVHFNLSHSSERGVIAVAREGPVGVDVELLRDLADADDIARRFFSRREAAAYLATPPEQRSRAFFNCWTRKEAFVKALGEGLFVSLDRFDVSLEPGRPARLEAIEGDAAAAREWTLSELAPAEGYIGALATRWRPASVRAWALDPPPRAPEP